MKTAFFSSLLSRCSHSRRPTSSGAPTRTTRAARTIRLRRTFIAATSRSCKWPGRTTRTPSSRSPISTGRRPSKRPP